MSGFAGRNSYRNSYPVIVSPEVYRLLRDLFVVGVFTLSHAHRTRREAPPGAGEVIRPFPLL